LPIFPVAIETSGGVSRIPCAIALVNRDVET
jgi:hypothetical protein